MKRVEQMSEIKDYALTHGGKFHADDVFSAALLKILNPNIKIIRAFEVPKDFDGIVFDIGLGRFDHHQEDAPVRENGVPYAAFGLLWREFGVGLLSKGLPPEEAEKQAANFDEKLIQPLDLDDNTGCGNQLASAIGGFNPSWDSDEPADACFERAVEFASEIIKNRIEGIFSAQRAKELVETALADSKDNIVVLPKFAPWKAVLAPSDAVFVVYPSQRGGYSAQGVPVDLESKELKCYFPQEWAGKSSKELARISGIETLTFCHKGRFMVSAGRLDDVIRACKLARETAERENAPEAENKAGE